jgi:hypothetical protein
MPNGRLSGGGPLDPAFRPDAAPVSPDQPSTGGVNMYYIEKTLTSCRDCGQPYAFTMTSRAIQIPAANHLTIGRP